jgi:hypothetical protein
MRGLRNMQLEYNYIDHLIMDHKRLPDDAVRGAMTFHRLSATDQMNLRAAGPTTIL